MPCNVILYNGVLQTASSGVYTLAWYRKAPLFLRQSDWQISNSMHGAIQKVWWLRTGKRGFLNSKQKRKGRRGGQAYLYGHSVKKNYLIFQTANRVLSDKLLGSC